MILELQFIVWLRSWIHPTEPVDDNSPISSSLLIQAWLIYNSNAYIGKFLHLKDFDTINNFFLLPILFVMYNNKFIQYI